MEIFVQILVLSFSFFLSFSNLDIRNHFAAAVIIATAIEPDDIKFANQCQNTFIRFFTPSYVNILQKF